MRSLGRPVERALENAHVYRLWQGRFARRKLAPLLRHTDLGLARRVLDVGCGPGTSAGHFAHASYVGLDVNLAYLRHARRRCGGVYVVGDACRWPLAHDRVFDCILVNSLLHHLDTPCAERLLGDLARCLTEDGHVHVLDLVRPDSAGSPAALLARWDRGKHARPLPVWRRMFAEHFEPVLFEPYALTGLGVPLWHMVYFKGRRKR